jgi:hypothetical protein
MRVALPELLPAKAHCDARDCGERKSRSGVDARHNESIRRDSRLEVVLGFVEVAIGQVIEAEIQFHSSADLLGHSQVDNGMSGGDDRRILPVPTKPTDRHGTGIRRIVLFRCNWLRGAGTPKNEIVAAVQRPLCQRRNRAIRLHAF